MTATKSGASSSIKILFETGLVDVRIKDNAGRDIIDEF